MPYVKADGRILKKIFTSNCKNTPTIAYGRGDK